MIRKLFIFLSAALVLACSINAAYAQRPWVGWLPEDGVAIRQGYHTEWYRGGEGRYLGVNAGEVAFVWSDTRNGDRGVYTQVIDNQVRVKFDDGGARITDAPNRQEDPQIWPSNSDGGWFVGWEDFDADTLGDIYATKIDANGNRVEGWGDERGVGVCIWEGVQYDIRIVDDGEGGCIIAWIDQRGGDTADLYAQHILADGTIDPNWRNGGIPIVLAEGAQNGHTADADGVGGMIIGWRDGREALNFNIWAQRVSPSGQLLWGNGQGIQVCAEGHNQEAPKVCPDGAGGAFFTWVDDRNLDQFHKDIFVQRVSADGQILWADGGEALVNVANEQSEPRIVNNAAGEAIVAWIDYRANGLTTDVYSMRLSGANRLRKEWEPADGVPVAVEIRNQQQARLHPDGQGGAYYVWEDERNGGFPEIDIYAQHINRNGQPVWQGNGIPICTAPNTQNAPLVRRVGNDAMVTAWGDYRTGSQEIWCQAVTSQGALIFQQNGIPLVEGIGGNATSPRGFARDDGSITLYWLDGRYGGNGTVPYITNIRNGEDAPEVRFDFNGIPVMGGTQGGGINPDACPGNDGSTIVVWEDHRLGDIYAIYAQRVSRDGELLWGGSGMKIAEYFDEQSTPKVVSDGQGGAFVCWRAPSVDGDNNIFGQHLNAAGDKLWGDEGRGLAITDADEISEQIISDEEGGFVVTWIRSVLDEETYIWDDNIWANRFNAAGEGLWGDGNGIPIVDTIGRQKTSKIAKHGLGYMIVWVDGRNDNGDGAPGNDIYGQFVKNNGEIAWERNGRVLTDIDEHQDNPDIAINHHGMVWLVWEDLRNIRTANHIDIYMNKFFPPQSPDEPLVLQLGEPGRRVAFGRRVVSTVFNQLKPTVIHDGQNGAYVGWVDFRLIGIHSEIYATHFRPNGTPYELWQINGNPITTAFHKQEAVQLINFTPGGETGAVVLWEDKRSTGKEELSNVYVQLLNANPLEVEESVNSNLPNNFVIETIAPNPFNPTAELTFNMNTAADVRIGLYDISGRLAYDFGTEFRGIGRHTILLQGGNLAAGSYIVRLETTSGSVERKVQLVK